MKLAQALRKGSMILKPVKGKVHDGQDGGCAIGMIAIGYSPVAISFPNGAGVLIEPEVFNKFKGFKFPVPCECTRVYPEMIPVASINRSKCWKSISYHKKIQPCDVMELIMHMFDEHVMTRGDWTIDQLADYLGKLEDDLDQKINNCKDQLANIPQIDENIGEKTEKEPEPELVEIS